MTKYLIILSFLLSGCGKLPNLHALLVQMPDEVTPYYNQFFDIVGYNREVAGQVTIEPLKSFESNGYKLSTASLCASLGAYYKIVLDTETWNNSTEAEKRETVFHELTHCALLSSEVSSDPHSYMFPMGSDTQLSLIEITGQVIDWTLHLKH